jgi:hypothetical protein
VGEFGNHSKTRWIGSSKKSHRFPSHRFSVLCLFTVSTSSGERLAIPGDDIPLVVVVDRSQNREYQVTKATPMLDAIFKTEPRAVQ